jgi:hypothetical protein
MKATPNNEETSARIRSIIWDFLHTNKWSDPDDFSLNISLKIFATLRQHSLSVDSMLKLLKNIKTTFFRVNKVTKKEFANLLVSDIGSKLVNISSDIRNANPKIGGVVRILFLAANPKDTDSLRLQEEIREIENRIALAQKKHLFELIKEGAVRVDDLQFYLSQESPDIVHFCGHGTEEGQIILEDKNGEAVAVPPKALTRVFKVLKGNIRCVILNACFSYPQAYAISKEIDCVIGMSSSIRDDAAIAFSSAFYLAIASGASVKSSFDQGITQIMLLGIPQENIPQLICRKGINPSKIFILNASS